MGSGWTITCVLLTSVVAFVSCFLLGFSFDTLEPLTMGIMFNQNTRLLECDTVYGVSVGGGSWRMFTGLGRGFYDYRFPVNSQYLLFSSNSTASGHYETLTTKTVEGATITMDLALQYRLPTTQPSLCNVVYNYGLAYNNFVVAFVRGAARDAVAPFAVSGIWVQRTAVGLAVKAALNATLTRAGFTFVDAQMLSLNIPTSLETEIENTSVQQQGIVKAMYNQQRQNVSAITALQQAEVQATIAVISARAAGTAATVTAKANAAALKLTTAAAANGYASFSTALVSNSTGVMAPLAANGVMGLAWVDTVLGLQAQKLLVSVDAGAAALP